MTTTTTIRNVPKGEYFKRKADAKKIYVRGTYDRASKGFECHDTDDVNRSIFIRADRPVVVGFTY